MGRSAVMPSKRTVGSQRRVRRVSPREMPRARDALLVGAILLSAAYELVLDAVLENPNALPEFEEDWSRALEESKKYEEEHQDPSEFDAELAAFWHEKKRANLFFRMCLDERQLAALVLDPRTGKPLELMPPGWVSDKWDTYIPSGIWDEYIDCENYDSPGPEGSVIAGAVRQVFFDKDDFQKWFARYFPSVMTQASSDLRVPDPLIGVSHKRGIDAVKFALEIIQQQGKTLAGLTKPQQLDLVNSILKEHNKPTYQQSTFYRALLEIRSDSLHK